MMRSWLAATCAALLLMACLPGLPARATDPITEIEKVAHKEAEAGPFKGSLDMTIWSIAVFLVLLAVLWKFAWGPIMQGLDKREKTIALALEEAKKAQDEARGLRADLQRQREEAARAAAAVVEEARRNAQRVVDDMMAKGRADLQADRERLHREVETAIDQGLADNLKQVADLATMVASKVVSRQLDGGDQRRLVDEALVELGPAAQQRLRTLMGLA